MGSACRWGRHVGLDRRVYYRSFVVEPAALKTIRSLFLLKPVVTQHCSGRLGLDHELSPFVVCARAHGCLYESPIPVQPGDGNQVGWAALRGAHSSDLTGTTWAVKDGQGAACPSCFLPYKTMLNRNDRRRYSFAHPTFLSGAKPTWDFHGSL